MISPVLPILYKYKFYSRLMVSAILSVRPCYYIYYYIYIYNENKNKMAALVSVGCCVLIIFGGNGKEGE